MRDLVFDEISTQIVTSLKAAIKWNLSISP